MSGQSVWSVRRGGGSLDLPVGLLGLAADGGEAVAEELELRVAPGRRHGSVLEYQDVVGRGQVLELVRDEDDELVPELTPDAVLEEVAPDGGVDGGERIVQEVDVRVPVDGSREVQTCLLAACMKSMFIAGAGEACPIESFVWR